MSRILVVGVGPLFEAGVRNFGAHALRTWHLTSPLVKAGHEVRLFTLPIMGEDPADQVRSGIESRSIEGFEYRAFLNCDEHFILDSLERECGEFHPDALLGVNAYPCYLLAGIRHVAPMWADFNGWLPAEAQLKAAVHGNNFLLGRFWEMEQRPLRRADKFSTSGLRQFYALMGELASVGRLNRHTFNYPFAQFIPEAFNPFFVEIASGTPPAPSLREGGRLPKNAFAVLWSGGYNSWTDADVLYQGLEQAMRECPELHYVSTGGAIYGHNSVTYERFQRLVTEGPFRDRFHLLGWVPAEDLPGIYASCDLGLCVDSDNYETMFGARNRTINMLAARLPVLTTVGAEISEELVNSECALGCRVGDAGDLARGLIAANWRRGQLRQMAERGREYVIENFSYERTTRELVAWAGQPAHAPDISVKITRAGGQGFPFDIPTNPIEERLYGANHHATTEPPLDVRRNPINTTAQKLLGERIYQTTRYAIRRWPRESWSRYVNARKAAGTGKSVELEELLISFHPAPGAGSDTFMMRLADFIAVAKSLPRLQRTTWRGGDLVRHPEAAQMIEAVAEGAKAPVVSIRSNGIDPIPLQTLCINLIEEGRLPGMLEVWIELEGDETAHAAAHPEKNAWMNANHSLELLREVREAFNGKMDFGVVTTLGPHNHAQMESLNERLERHPACRHVFELPNTRGLGVWGVPNDLLVDMKPEPPPPPQEAFPQIIRSLRRIQRKTRWRDRAQFVALERALAMHEGRGRDIPCVAAGQSVAVLYADGSMAMCGLTRPALNLKDHDWDFQQAWQSEAARRTRDRLQNCACTQPCFLARNLLATLSGQMAMLRKL